MPKLTEKRHRQTQADIAAAAVALFTQQGYDVTTMEQVAEAAGVSRRTAYRHFPAKEELLNSHPRLWLGHYNAVLASRRPDEATRDCCRRGLLAVAEVIEENRVAVLEAWAVVASTEALRANTARTQQEWVERHAALIGPDLAAEPDATLRTMTLAGALVAATNALVMVWAMQQPAADMPTMTRAALDYLDPLWPEQTRCA